MLPQEEEIPAIRRARPEDASVCGQICFDAFSKISAAHGFACDFPAVQAAQGVMTHVFSDPAFYCVVAEINGRIVGSNALDERAEVAGVGPITVDPTVQNRGVGRRLMQAVLERAESQGKKGVRLVQAAYHNRSLSLYAELGFDVREPLSCMQGQCRGRVVAGCSVRSARAEDAAACNALAMRVHGFERAAELAAPTAMGAARVVERDGRITGYASALAFFGHAVAETNVDLQALIASAESFGGAGILVPVRNAELFRWCLGQGLRVVQPLTWMTMGFYVEPAGAWLPSILL